VLYKKLNSGVVGARKLYIGKKDSLDARTADSALILESQRKFQKLSVVPADEGFDL
jgi:hypothetical protein